MSQWSDAHRQLPKKSSAEPGSWRTARTPYLREVMDCLSSQSEVQDVTLMKASQLGGTETILCALGYIIDHAPGPTILVQPTIDAAKKFSRQRVEPLISSTPRLSGKVAEARSRDSGNTVLGKEFPAGILIITGANSAVGLRSMPAQYALLDEVDQYPIDVDDEGSPIDLVEARQRTFTRRKTLKVSSPTLAGLSAIEISYEDSDKRRYYVPCPDCGEMQPLEFERLVWTKYGLPPEKAVYECRACEFQIQEYHKTEMLARGEWRAENPSASQKIRGYHINALYSPVGWLSWGDIARKFTKVKGNPEKLRVFINTMLGQVWHAKGEAPPWDALMRRRESYEIGTVPKGALFLTAGVDVQKDRLVIEVVGWGRGKQSWSIDYGQIPGDTADLEHGPWKQLDEALGRTYPHENGAELPIRMMAVDTGYHTQTVHTWCKRYPWSRVIPVKGKGVAAGGMLIGTPRPVEITSRGKKSPRGARVWPVTGGIAKSELFGWLRLEIPPDGGEAPPGYCHFPEYGEEYFKELTGEQLVAKKNKRGYAVLEWQLLPGRVNHVLDARVYARAAAALVGLDRYRDSDWSALEDALARSADSDAVH